MYFFLIFLEKSVVGTDYGLPMKEILKFGSRWQTKYASAVPKNLGLGGEFWPCSESNFLNRCPQSVVVGTDDRL